MKDYLSFGVVEFVQDDLFLKWVKYPGLYPEIDRFWKSWLAQHPYKLEETEEARRMIVAITEEGESLQISRKEDEVLARLRTSLEKQPSTNQEPRFWSSTYRMAASVMMVLSVSVFCWFAFRGNKPSQQTPTIGKGNFIKEVNNGTLPKTIVLADGSSIILQPNSALQYPKVFSKEQREVILTGEGFFEISKDPQRPFLVYTDKLITKVLGTSFKIRAFDTEKDILVQVRTGKVSVFSRSEEKQNEKKDNIQKDVVLLVPNQQVIFSRKDSKLVKSLVEDPALLNFFASGSFVFKDTPLKEVFTSLEEAYGVDIIYDDELMSKCSLNASLEDMPLYDKMRLICKTIEARYEIVDSHIVVTGKGCKD